MCCSCVHKDRHSNALLDIRIVNGVLRSMCSCIVAHALDPIASDNT